MDIESFIKREKEKSLFFGTIVTKLSKNNKLNQYILVDGQQRITTLFLMLRLITELNYVIILL